MDIIPPVGTEPGTPYTDPDELTHARGSRVPAAAISAPMHEIVNVIKASGMEPSTSDLTQLLQAIMGLDVVTRQQFDVTKKMATNEFVQRALGSLAGASAFGENTALDKTAVGKAIGVTAAGLTFTLPPSNSVPPGALIHLYGNGFGLNVSRAGDDLIVLPPNSVTTFAIGALDSAVFRRATGGGAWVLDAGSAFLKFSTAFGSSLGASQGAPSWAMSPSGLIVQMGSSSPTNGIINWVFPRPFTESVFFLSGSIVAASSTDFGIRSVQPVAGSITKTGAQFVVSNNGAAAPNIMAKELA